MYNFKPYEDNWIGKQVTVNDHTDWHDNACIVDDILDDGRLVVMCNSAPGQVHIVSPNDVVVI